MIDETYQRIVDGIDLLASGEPKRSNGKITSSNLIKESGVSKATLYRYFKKFPDLFEIFIKLRRKGVTKNDSPFTLEEENNQLKNEIKSLRANISSENTDALLKCKVYAHKIFILHQEVNRLNTLIINLRGKLSNFDNITILP